MVSVVAGVVLREYVPDGRADTVQAIGWSGAGAPCPPLAPQVVPPANESTMEPASTATEQAVTNVLGCARRTNAAFEAIGPASAWWHTKLALGVMVSHGAPQATRKNAVDRAAQRSGLMVVPVCNRRPRPLLRGAAVKAGIEVMTRSSAILCKLTLLVIALAGLGCAGWTGSAQARRAAIHEGLTSLHLGVGSRVALTQAAFRVGCDVAPDGHERCRMSDGKAKMTLLDDPEGSRVIAAEGTEAQLIAMWERLDVESFSRFSKSDLEPLVRFKLDEEAQAFTPRWGLVAGISSAATTDGLTSLLGGRLGVRRWFDVHFAAHAAVEYQYAQGTTEHRFGLRLGGELARFTEGRFFGKVGAAPAAVSAFTGPMVGTSRTISGLASVWWRTGLGVTVNDWYWAPMFFELIADTVIDAHNQPGVVFAFALGFGF